jgi:hypothetical protein
LAIASSNKKTMLTLSTDPEEEKEWENPKDPEAPSDQRDKEQIERQYEEAQRRKENLTEEKETDKPKGN